MKLIAVTLLMTRLALISSQESHPTVSQKPPIDDDMLPGDEEFYNSTNQNLYLFISDQEERIYYLELGEDESTGAVIKKSQPDVLLQNLSKPTYLEYDYDRHHLYFCEDDALEIKGVPITYKSDGSLHPGPQYTIMRGTDCGDLKLDKYGNLFFVERRTHFIAKLTPDQLDNATDGLPVNASIIYSQNLTQFMSYPEALTIEREYIYWTNVGQGKENGIIHKAFTEPYVRNLPIQSYTIHDLEESYAIASNPHYLFFSGLATMKVGNETQNTTELFMMVKEDASYYYNISSSFFSEPKTMIAIKHHRLLVADFNRVVVVNTLIYPPNSNSIRLDETIDLFEIRTPFGLALATQDQAKVFMGSFSDGLALKLSTLLALGFLSLLS